MKRNAWLILVLLAGALPGGCVTRRYVITSEPMGAIVYRNGQYLGPTPADDYFVYYGKYKFLLVKDGYQPMDVTADLRMPWYQIPGLDFFSENVIPCKFRDVHRLHYQLTPLETVSHADVRHRAEELRDRGKSIGSPGGPVPPPPGASRVPPGAPGPVVPGPVAPPMPVPPENTLPAPRPVVPSSSNRSSDLPPPRPVNPPASSPSSSGASAPREGSDR
jgi:hypothetical protein